MKLIVTEKPSVAREIADVVGATLKKDGYIEGNGYIVSWCVGHLVQLAEPKDYAERYAKWSIQDLPIFPDHFKYVVSDHTKKQFDILKRLLNDPMVDIVINACDAGREGELIFGLLYQKAGCKKKVQRLWISSMEATAIKNGFLALKDGKEYGNLFAAAEGRSMADWLVGMNLSRLYSCLYRQRYSVGRVQTPTLAMIVERDEKINNFKKEKYFIIKATTENFIISSERIDDYEKAEDILNKMGTRFEITDVIQKEKVTKPDLPFDLTTLQRECNKYFGYSAQETLDFAQSLYEKKLITYPRTDSRCLTEDMIVNTVNNILEKNDFDKARIKVVFNSKKVTDHHAIIPTISSLNADVSELPLSEAQVYRLITDKFHASVGYPLIEKNTKITALIAGEQFSATGKVIIDEGFMVYMKEYKELKESAEELPNLTKGQILDVLGKEIEEKFTTPPSHFTEDTLLRAMEVAGKEALDKNIDVEREGIGTPATRANIIETLIKRGFVERCKKNLIATHNGVLLITIVAENFKDPATTARWEMMLDDVAKGNASRDDFLAGIKSEIKLLLQKHEDQEPAKVNYSSNFSQKYKKGKYKKWKK